MLTIYVLCWIFIIYEYVYEAYYYSLHIFQYISILSFYHIFFAIDRYILHIKILWNAIKMKILWIYMHHSWDCTCISFSHRLLINIVPINIVPTYFIMANRLQRKSIFSHNGAKKFGRMWKLNQNRNENQCCEINPWTFHLISHH